MSRSQVPLESHQADGIEAPRALEYLNNGRFSDAGIEGGRRIWWIPKIYRGRYTCTDSGQLAMTGKGGLMIMDGRRYIDMLRESFPQ
jgi:hypothetical protein